MYKHFLLAGLGLALLCSATLTASILAIDLAEPFPVSCHGLCQGTSFGSAVSESSCGTLTREQFEELSQEACSDPGARSSARRSADVACSEISTGCICSGGFSPSSGVCIDSETGSTIFCVVRYSGTCFPGGS